MNPQENEQLRHIVLEILATRHPAALPIKAILRRADGEVDFQLTEGAVEAALVFLLGLGHVHSTKDPLGSSTYWNATSAGVLAWERSGNPRTPTTRE